MPQLKHSVFLLCALYLTAGCGSVVDEPGEDAGEPAVATLSDLVARDLELSPSFDPDVTSYTIEAPLFFDELELTADAPADHTIQIDGVDAAAAEPFAPIALALGATEIDVEVTTPDATSTTYTISVSRGRGVLDYLKQSNTEAGDLFGFDVAIDGDLLAVSAPFEKSASTGIDGNQSDNSASSAGAVYVFARDSSGVWVQEAYVKPAAIDVNDEFGRDLDLDGDTLVVGATGESSAATGVNGATADNSAQGSGAVWVFVREAAGWTQQAYLKASNTGTSDFFGTRVALDGDTLVVGARFEDSAATGVDGNQIDELATDAGAAYVFFRQNGLWSQQAYLKASNTSAGDKFGGSVAVSGDTVIVGAPSEASAATGVSGDQSDDSATNAGAIYVFARTGTSWVQQAYIKASNTDAGDRFGFSAAVSGDTLAVAALFEASAAAGVNGDQLDNSATNAGAVYVFARVDGAWRQQAYLKASNSQPSGFFGDAIALDGDALVVSGTDASSATGLDGDQTLDDAPGAGSAYAFFRRGDSWRQTLYIKASNTDASDQFGGLFVGTGVDISGDSIAAGAAFEGAAVVGVNGDQTDNGAPSSGAAYVYR
jgi:hypothetical protein